MLLFVEVTEARRAMNKRACDALAVVGNMAAGVALDKDVSGSGCRISCENGEKETETDDTSRELLQKCKVFFF